MSIAKIHEVLYQSGSFAGVDLVAYAGTLVPQLLAPYGVRDRIEVAVQCLHLGLANRQHAASFSSFEKMMRSVSKQVQYYHRAV